MAYYDVSGLDFLNPSSGSSSGGSPHGSSSGSSSPPSGGNGGGPAPSIDYGFDDSGGFIGEGWGGNPPPAPITVDTSGTGGGIIDVAAEQDAIDDAAAIAASANNPSTFIPHDQLYGANQADVVPGQTGYAFQNIDPQMVLNLGLDQIDPETAAFFGYSPGSSSVPNELLQSYIQGSIVSGNEAVETQHHYDTGTPWASGDPLTHAGEYVGTWNDLEAGDHPLFPGGLDEYYGYMDDPFTIPINYGEWGGGGDQWADWDYDDRRDAKLDLIAALQGGAPIKNLEQSGFHHQGMEDPYGPGQEEALDKGIFSGLQFADARGMKRLLKSYGSGLQAPLFANVAKGGIVGLLGV